MAQAKERETLPCPAQLVWRTVTGEDQLSWRTGLKALEQEAEGIWLETGTDGSRYRLEQVVWEPERRVVLRVTGRNTYGKRELLLEESSGGTTVTIYSETMGESVFADLMEGAYLRRWQREYLRDLRRRLWPPKEEE